MKCYNLILLFVISSLVGCNGSGGSGIQVPTETTTTPSSSEKVYYFSATSTSMSTTNDLVSYNAKTDRFALIDKFNSSGDSQVKIFKQDQNSFYYSAFNGSYHIFKYNMISGVKTQLTTGSFSSGFSSIWSTVQLGSNLYFGCANASSVRDVCKIDSSDHITIVTAASGKDSSGLYSAGDYLFVQANDGVTGSELYVYDPILDSFDQIQDLNSGSGSSATLGVFVVNDKYYVIATLTSGGTDPAQIYYLDDNAADPSAPMVNLTLGQVNSGVDYLGNRFGGYFTLISGSNVYFFGKDSFSISNLFKLDTTNNSINKLTSFTGYTGAAFGLYINGNYAYTTGKDVAHGNEIVKIDLASAGCSSHSCSYSVIDINPNSSNSSDPGYFKVIGTKIFTSANDGVHGYELVEINLLNDSFIVHDLRIGATGSGAYLYGLFGDTFMVKGDLGSGTETFSLDLTSDVTETYLDGSFEDVFSNVADITIQ